MRTKPLWTDVNKALAKVAEYDNEIDLIDISPKVFAQYGHVKAYCNDMKLQEWKTNNVSTEQRWVELFKHMEANEIPYLDFTRVIEFPLCLPGANAITERVFSEIKNWWNIESSRLSIETMKAIMLVKLNLDYKCTEFYDLLGKNPEMLKQITSVDKYDFKKKKDSNVNEGTVNLNMSID